MADDVKIVMFCCNWCVLLQLVFLWRSRHSWYCTYAIPTEY